jgi:hypothetical protein
LQDGKIYINVHSLTAPAGLIRGNLYPAEGEGEGEEHEEEAADEEGGGGEEEESGGEEEPAEEV